MKGQSKRVGPAHIPFEAAVTGRKKKEKTKFQKKCYSFGSLQRRGYSRRRVRRKRKRNERKQRKFLQLITYFSETDMCVCISIHHIKCQQKIKYTASMISLMKLVMKNC